MNGGYVQLAKRSIYLQFPVVSSVHKLGSYFALPNKVLVSAQLTTYTHFLTLDKSPFCLLFEELSK